MTAREAVLASVREALGPHPPKLSVPRAYRGAAAGADTEEALELFCERAADYRAEVVRVSKDELEAALAAACARRATRAVVAAPGVSWSIPGVTVTKDGRGISPAGLDKFDAALTGCALAIAETGTIVLDGDRQSGRRALTLVPDHHLCVVVASQIVRSVPDAVAALGPAARDGRPITLISGPSATSDIELERVEGVHGPRLLDIVVVA
jgi:L-lactate dehydrogenase complex protein LldG